MFSVAPIIDMLLNPDLKDASNLTKKILSIFELLNIPGTLHTMLVVLLFLIILRNSVNIVVQYLILKTKYYINANLVVDTFGTFFQARWQFFSSSNQGNLLNTFTREVGIVSDTYRTLAMFVVNSFQAFFYLIVPFYISWKVTLISMVTALVLSLPLLLFGRLSYKLGKLSTSTSNVLIGILHEDLGAAKIILGFGNQPKSVVRLREAFNTHVKITLQSQTLSTAMPSMHEPIGILVVIVAVISAQYFAIPLSEAVVLLWAIRLSMPALGEVLAQKNNLTNFIPSYEQVKILEGQAISLKQPSGVRPFAELRDEISLGSVSFSYPAHDKVLHNIDMRIPKGQMVALVGESGAGKSTLIDILMGFNQPTEGNIYIDGVPLSEFDITTYRQRIGYVPQDTLLFNASIKNNLLWAKADASQEEIAWACAQAHADEFICELPQKYDTPVGDRGVRLSGGQAQRIALARAIIRKPELLILDEATSALDSHSEHLIQKAIEAVARETTIVTIAHRLSTVINADYIYVLSGGRLVEEGNYESLMRHGGHFFRMARMQKLYLPNTTTLPGKAFSGFGDPDADGV